MSKIINKITFLVLLVTLFTGCTSAIQSQGVKNIDVTKFQQLMKNPDVIIMDVRTPEEVKEGYIKGATVFADINSSDFDTQIASLDKAKTYLVYCRSGGRSASACNQLVNKGFSKVYNLTGGINNWTGEVVR